MHETKIQMLKYVKIARNYQFHKNYKFKDVKFFQYYFLLKNGERKVFNHDDSSFIQRESY